MQFANYNNMGKRKETSKMKQLFRILLSIVLTFMVYVLGAWAEDYPKMNLRYANMIAKQIPSSKVQIYVAEELTKQTNGAVNVQIFHGGTLGSSAEMIDLIGEGAVDIGNFVSSYVFSRLPMQAFFTMPLVYPDIQSVTQLTRQGWQKSKKMQEDLVKNKLYPFGFAGMAVTRIISKKPIHSLKDLQGLKVRTFGPTFPILLQKLGAVPVNLQFNEVYEGLQRGTVDAALASYTSAYYFKYFEVAKYFSDINLGTDFTSCTYVNLDLYNKWPPNLKTLFNTIVKEAEVLSDKIHIGFEDYARDEQLKAGVKVIHFQDQDKVTALKDYAIDLTVEAIAKQGKEYEKPAMEYAKWLKAELAKRRK